MNKLILSLGLSIFLFSCGESEADQLKAKLSLKDQKITMLEDQLTHLKTTNGSLLDRMAELSIINQTGAENISKSLENISQQYGFIQDLTSKVQSKDSLNLALVMNLKRSLLDVNDEDIQVEVRGGVVKVSIADKLLFRSGSSTINRKAESVLGKIASVLNDHDQLEVIVEGHTDDVPINNNAYVDNWDLSVSRATSVVRSLSQDYGVNPERLTAAGKSEFAPKTENETATGRRINRRTEIIIQPRMDQFFELLEAPVLQG